MTGKITAWRTPERVGGRSSPEFVRAGGIAPRIHSVFLPLTQHKKDFFLRRSRSAEQPEQVTKRSTHERGDMMKKLRDELMLFSRAAKKESKLSLAWVKRLDLEDFEDREFLQKAAKRLAKAAENWHRIAHQFNKRATLSRSILVPVTESNGANGADGDAVDEPRTTK